MCFHYEEGRIQFVDLWGYAFRREGTFFRALYFYWDHVSVHAYI